MVTVPALAFGANLWIKANAQGNSPQESSAEPQEEKTLMNRHPPGVPVKVKVKNLNSKKWAHDLEVEVTNTSDKLIYFLHFYISLPEIKGPMGHTFAFWLKYGRGELLDFSTPLEPTDIPIQPGEKCTLKIPESSAKAWDNMKEKEGKPEPKRIELLFQGLNFGDSTGYADAAGTPVNIHKKINFNKTCVPPMFLRTFPVPRQFWLTLQATVFA